MPEENDPDTLQLLDEMNYEWVSGWRKKVNKKNAADSGLTFIVAIPEKEAPNEIPDSNMKATRTRKF